MFRDIAVSYFNLLLSGSRESILKVFKFIDAPLRNVRHFTKIMVAEKPFYRCVDKYFETSKAPIDDSPKTLPDIKPPAHLIGSALSSFSKLCDRFRNTRASWMLSAFFLAQLFREITDSNDLSSEAIVTNMLEELLLNCSVRELKTNPKEKNIQFHEAEYFTRTFMRILTEEQSSNRNQENDENSRYRENIRGVFKKDPRARNSLIEQVKNIRDTIKAHNESINQESGYTYRGLSSDIQSQILSTESIRSDNSSLRNLTIDSKDASTPISTRISPKQTRSRVNVDKISGSRKYSYLELDRNNKARRVEEKNKEIKEEVEDE